MNKELETLIQKMADNYCKDSDGNYLEEDDLDKVKFDYSAGFKDANACSFAEWMVSGVTFIDDTKDDRIYDYRHKNYTTEELYLLYLKTKEN